VSPLAESRCLQLIPGGVTVEPETLGFCRPFQAIEMHVEIGDPFIGIELHRFFKIAHRRHSSSVAKQRTRALADCWIAHD
jgi:hypothetical protein